MKKLCTEVENELRLMRQIKYSVMWKFKLSFIEVADNTGIYNCWT